MKIAKIIRLRGSYSYKCTKNALEKAVHHAGHFEPKIGTIPLKAGKLESMAHGDNDNDWDGD